MHNKVSGHEELSLDNLRPGSWINAIAPTRQELEDVARLTAVPLDFLTAATDVEESSRIDLEEADADNGHTACMLLVINIPKHPKSFDFDTLPLGIIVTSDVFITVCLEENDILPGPRGGISGFCTWKRTRFLLQILYKTAGTYLQYINEMNRMSDHIENALRQSMKNEELFKLMDLEKGMTFFTGALRSNRVAVDKLVRTLNNVQFQKLVKMREEDEDLLEDVIVEYDQAYDMVRVYSDVLGGMMDAFASIISNNLNIVMKFLASMTIIISIPTVVSSFWGMNVGVPWSEARHGFAWVMGVAVGLSSVAAYWLWKKRMF
ncbi:MAG: magnesium transporter CorA family protein [Synergistaceae bacterium]|jgi:magnesium transporter|nr:magnesium transporter CorA family protein [Synergistaceae bacterium]